MYEMNSRLPPLNALRAFVVAAQHLSFARAAEELHVTPAAISHQIKALEQHVGVKLFRRRSRAIELTEAARACLPKLREGFERLGEAAEQLRTHEGGDTLAVSVATSLATKWLVPRLYRFVTAHPEVDVRISASTRLIDIRRTRIAGGTEQIGPRLDEADICIRFGTGEYPGFSVVKLFPVSVAPVCSPQLADAEPALRRPEDLRTHVLIQDDTVFFDGTMSAWDHWLRAAGASDVDTSRGPRFSHAALALEAAADGLGVALSPTVLAKSDLAAGRLVMPFELSLPLVLAYYIVSPETAADTPSVRAFRDWLLEEGAGERSA
jgi:LysR family glycine cleavage system transcriptional activator